ncbi:MAG: hypothetical protein ACPGEC_04905 [Flavobacteriales bacterium]
MITTKLIRYLKLSLVLILMSLSLPSCTSQAQPNQHLKSKVKALPKLSYQYTFGGRGRTRSVRFKTDLQSTHFKNATLVVDTFRLELKAKTKGDMPYLEAHYRQTKAHRDDDFEPIVLFERPKTASIYIESDEEKRININAHQLKQEPNIYYP